MFGVRFGLDWTYLGVRFVTELHLSAALPTGHYGMLVQRVAAVLLHWAITIHYPESPG